MQPAPVGSGPYLCPHVVRPVRHVTRGEAKCPAHQREAVRPFAAPPSSRGQKHPRVVVARKSVHALAEAATVKLHPLGPPRELCGSGRRHSERLLVFWRPGATRPRTAGFIDPLEKVFFEPMDELPEQIVFFVFFEFLFLGTTCTRDEPLQG